MMFDSEKFLSDFQIPCSKSGKHARAGWIQIKCPFCSGHPGWHGGFNLNQDWYNCWRCGWHSIPDVIMSLLQCDNHTARLYFNKYQTSSEDSKQNISYTPSPSSLLIPGHQLHQFHKGYLEKRGFNPDELVTEWDIRSTAGLGEYAYRIIAPIYFNHRLVSYQGRDVTGKQPNKYKACRTEDEVVHHKHILYGIDKIRTKTVIIVEGIFDVWKLGPGVVATFGIKYTLSQVRLLLDRFDKFVIFFDDEYEAQLQAEKLGTLLNGFNKEVELISESEFEDPGNLSLKDARQLKRELLVY